MSKPEFPRPSVGDELIVFEQATRYREERVTPVRVRKMARFRVELEGLDGEDLREYTREFDIRDQLLWNVSRRDGRKLHTAETLAYWRKQKAVEGVFREHGIQIYRFRGALRKATDADPLAFANLLLRFAGEDEI